MFKRHDLSAKCNNTFKEIAEPREEDFSAQSYNDDKSGACSKDSDGMFKMTLLSLIAKYGFII